MPNYVLDQSATNVNTAINNVVNAQSAPANGSGLMVTSDGIYQALNDIQHTNFNTGTLVTSGDTIASNSSDTQIPTTQAVADHVSTAAKSISTGLTQLGTTSASGTAQTDGFIIGIAKEGTGNNYTLCQVSIQVGGVTFPSITATPNGSACLSIPIAAGETYNVTTAAGGSGPVRLIYFKALV